MSRIPLADRIFFPPEEHEVFDRLEQRPPPIANIYMLLAQAPNIANAALTVSEAFRASLYVSAELREIVILYIAARNDGEYEFAHHRNAAIGLGIAKDKIQAIEDFSESPLFSASEKAALRLARDLQVPPLKVSNDTWEALTGLFETRVIVELIQLIGWYHFACRFNGALETCLEDWFEPR